MPSAGERRQSRPDSVDGDLADGSQAVAGDQFGEAVTVQAGAGLAALGVGDPRERVGAGGGERGFRTLLFGGVGEVRGG